MTCLGALSQTLVVYSLQKVSGKSGWKVNETKFFGSFQRENFREQRNISKGSPVFSGRNL